MSNPPTLVLSPEAGSMLFADCPFCLQPVPLDARTGTIECPDCAVRLELADDFPAPALTAAA